MFDEEELNDKSPHIVHCNLEKKRLKTYHHYRCLGHKDFGLYRHCHCGHSIKIFFACVLHLVSD